MRHAENENDQPRVQDEQVAHDTDDLLLLPVGGMGGAHQFRRFAEKGARASRRDDARGFSAPHQRAGVGGFALRDLDSGGFAGERRLIHQQRAVAHPHVGGHDAALAQMNQVVGHQFLRADGVPLAVAPHAGLDVELLPQQRQRLLGFALLQKTEHRVHHQQPGDDARLDPFAQEKLDDDGRFQQPRDRRPEPAEELAQRMRLFLAHGVGAELGEPRAGFGGSQAGGIAAGGFGSFAGYVEWWSGFHIPKRRQHRLVQAVLANALVILARGVRPETADAVKVKDAITGSWTLVPLVPPVGKAALLWTQFLDYLPNFEVTAIWAASSNGT